MEHEVIQTYTNPLNVQLADPFVLLHEGTYYLYGTHDRNPHLGIPVYTSHDLVHWQWQGFAFRKHRKSWAQHHFWGPEVIQVDNTFYMFMSASPNTHTEPPYHMRIVTARADSPLGPFDEWVTPLFEPKNGDEAIDQNLFIDDDGTPVLFWTNVTKGRNEIVCSKMKDCLIALAEEPSIVIVPEQPWESNAWEEHRVTEGPYVFKHDGSYFLIYTGNHFLDPRYAIGYAKASDIRGPWNKFTNNPILQKTDYVAGPGNGMIIPSPDGTELFMVYHTHQSPREAGWRQLAIDRVRLESTEDQTLVLIDGPSHTPQPLPSGTVPWPVAQTITNFSEPIAYDQWLIVNETPVDWEQKDAKLLIHTSDGDMWKKRADFENLFLQHAPQGDFVVKTHVEFHPAQNFEQAFLIVYQDHDHYVRLSHAYDNDLEFLAAHEVAGEFQFSNLPNSIGSNVFLAIQKEGIHYTLRVSADNINWQIVGQYEAHFEQPMVGIGAISPGSESRRTATFSNFIIETEPQALQAQTVTDANELITEISQED